MRLQVNVEQALRSLGHLAVNVPKGATLFLEGQPAEHFYLVIGGRVVETAASDGRQKILGILGPGDFAGAAAAVAGTAHWSTLRAVEDTTAIRLPADSGVDLLLAHGSGVEALVSQVAYDHAVLAAAAFATAAGEPPAMPPARASSGTAELGAFDQATFYAGERTCPVCKIEFATLSVRSKAIYSVKRDSDFHYDYRGVNPTHYSVIVCPECRYAAPGEEFEAVPPREARLILAAAPDRQQKAGRARLGGERDIAAVKLSLELAIMTHEARGGSARKRGSFYHRLAWLAREQGNPQEEHEYLRLALADYDSTFQNDKITDNAALNLAYLMGDTYMRLGDDDQAIRWFDAVNRMDEVKKHPEIARLTRQLWADIRQRRSA